MLMDELLACVSEQQSLLDALDHKFGVLIIIN